LVLWIPLRAEEVIDLIRQLAANVGCHIHIQPQQDFSSWRQWKELPEQLSSQHAAFLNSLLLDKVEHKNQLGLDNPIRSNKDEPMAIKKPVNRRSTKQATKTS